MTRDEAKNQLLQEVEREARTDMVRIIRQIEEEARVFAPVHDEPLSGSR